VGPRAGLDAVVYYIRTKINYIVAIPMGTRVNKNRNRIHYDVMVTLN